MFNKFAYHPYYQYPFKDYNAWVQEDQGIMWLCSLYMGAPSGLKVPTMHMSLILILLEPFQ